jgi:hypothetical protein
MFWRTSASWVDKDDKVPAAGVTMFPRKCPSAARGERSYHMLRWEEMPRGGTAALKSRVVGAGGPRLLSPVSLMRLRVHRLDDDLNIWPLGTRCWMPTVDRCPGLCSGITLVALYNQQCDACTSGAACIHKSSRGTSCGRARLLHRQPASLGRGAVVRVPALLRRSQRGSWLARAA